MVNDLAAALAHLAENTPPSGDTSNSVLLAIIAAGGVVLAAAISVYGGKRTSEPRHPLNSDSDDEEDDQLRDRVRALEIFLWQHHYNPNRIVTGEEADADVHFQ